MAKNKKKHTRRIKNLALVCTLATILLVTSTYAWFVGMRTVRVKSFDVKIAAVDGLSLSLDGTTWTESLDVSTAPQYEGNTNAWAEKGLKPVSSVGAVDTTSATLKLYEKASIKPTTGGYRLLASRVNNNTADASGDYVEQEGYVAFDLFIKNLSGQEYYPGAYNVNNEEAIYLTNDSSVNVSTSGGVAGTGIENSVRIAFAQIGRVISTTESVEKITGLTCATDEVPEGQDPKQYATGICRTATIWEPNDRNHTTDAISYYENSCKSRSNTDGTYSGTCATLVNGLPKTTYAISDEIHYKTEDGKDAAVVDIYDGTDYNGYTKSTVLQGFDTFTDSEKLQSGSARPEFFTLAPNSITKVRVYIYIEGQDIDNYDLAQIGKKVSINFGFTKDRFNEEDVNYTGAATNEGDGPFVEDGEGGYVQATDKTKPYIILKDKTSGEEISSIEVDKDAEFVLADKVTATAHDKVSTFSKETDAEGNDVYKVTTVADQALEAEITTSGVVNTAQPGTYQIVYSVKDAAGNLGTKVLNVIVKAPTEPGE